MLNKYLKEGMDFRYHVTDLPHLSKEVPGALQRKLPRLGQGHTAGAAGLDPAVSLLLLHLPVPWKGD